MRVNVYAEEMTDRVEIISKEIDGHRFTGLRFYLELPCTIPEPDHRSSNATRNVRGPFVHRPGDDDSAAVTFWGKKDLRDVLRKALSMLDAHYGEHETSGRMTDARFEGLIAKARRTNAKRDAGDRKNGFAAPGDAPLDVEVGTIKAALECGIRLGDQEALAEAFAMVEDCLARLRKAIVP